MATAADAKSSLSASLTKRPGSGALRVPPTLKLHILVVSSNLLDEMNAMSLLTEDREGTKSTASFPT